MSDVATLAAPIVHCRPSRVPEAARWKMSDRVLHRVVLGDLVVVSAEGDAEPVALSGGVHLWVLLTEPRTTKELAEALGSSESTGDMERLLLSLAGSGVVERIES